MKIKIRKYILIAIILFFSSLFVAEFGGPAILKGYVKMGVGDCRTMPLLCVTPQKALINPQIDKTYLDQLLPHTFPGKLLPYPLQGLSVSVPKGFTVIRGSITKVYYKRKKFGENEPTIYLLYQKPGFFIKLFPQLKKQGIQDNYQFLSRIMQAQFANISNLTDAFFVILKSIFTPDLGEMKNIKIAQFLYSGKKGFITYNLIPSRNYYDCDVVDENDAYFKIYIKDTQAQLDLDKVIAVISTMGTSNVMAAAPPK